MSDKKDLPFPEATSTNIVLFEENITKSEIASKAESTIEAVNEGHVPALETYLQVRAVKEVCDTVIKGIKDTVVDEVDNLNEREREVRGVRFELTKGSIKYDFSHDDVWNDLQERLAEIKDQIKSREKLMINAIDYAEVYDDEGTKVEPATVAGGTAQVLKTVIPKG